MNKNLKKITHINRTVVTDEERHIVTKCNNIRAQIDANRERTKLGLGKLTENWEELQKLELEQSILLGRLQEIWDSAAKIHGKEGK